MSRQDQRTAYIQNVPDLNPDDAGFIRDLNFPPPASSIVPVALSLHYARRERPNTEPAQLPVPKRRRLTPTAAQRLTHVASDGGGCSSSGGAVLAAECSEGVFAGDSSDSDFGGNEEALVASLYTLDVLAALQVLKSEFPKAALAAGQAPLMLKSQLYTIVTDRTAVDRQLEALRLRNEVRSFKLASGQGDEYAFMFTSDYAVAVKHAAALLSATTSHSRAGSAARRTATASATASEVADCFLTSVVPRCCEVSITRCQLLSLLSVATAGSESDGMHSAASSAGPAAASTLTGKGPGATTPSPHDASQQLCNEGGVCSRAGMRSRAAPAAASSSGCRSAASGPCSRAGMHSRAAPAAVGSGGGRHTAISTRPMSAARQRLRQQQQQQQAREQQEKGGDRQQRQHGEQQAREVSEARVTVLLNCGLIARHPAHINTFLFGVPDVGPLVLAIRKGREELLGLVSRRKYSEIFEKEVTGRKLQRSHLDMTFHIRDLIGLGDIHRVATTSGPLLRARKR